MSKYTTEVRFICETYAGLTESTGYAKVNEIIAKAIPKVFDFDFPIFDEEYRSVLQTKILKHYYTREIGAETVGLWKLWLDTKLNEIMPYYNQLYKSELLKFNPLYDVDITRERDVKTDGTKKDTGTANGNTINTGTTTTSNSNKSYYSDTPQGSVSNLEDLSYLTTATFDNESGTNTNENNTTVTSSTNVDSIISNTEDYLERVSGKQGGHTYASMLIEYRKTFLNIDMQIIDELECLFMQLW